MYVLSGLVLFFFVLNVYAADLKKLDCYGATSASSQKVEVTENPSDDIVREYKLRYVNFFDTVTSTLRVSIHQGNLTFGVTDSEDNRERLEANVWVGGSFEHLSQRKTPKPTHIVEIVYQDDEHDFPIKTEWPESASMANSNPVNVSTASNSTVRFRSEKLDIEAKAEILSVGTDHIEIGNLSAGGFEHRFMLRVNGELYPFAAGTISGITLGVLIEEPIIDTKDGIRGGRRFRFHRARPGIFIPHDELTWTWQ